jgi:hypothetical protein
MSDRKEEPRRTPRSKGGQSPARYLYGALLVAIGGCLGIVIGSVSDTPRILFERLRGPVETVDLEQPPAPAPARAGAPAARASCGEPHRGDRRQGAKPAPALAEGPRLAPRAREPERQDRRARPNRRPAQRRPKG